MLLCIALLVLVAVLFYKFVWKPFWYWRKRGVPADTSIPFLGCMSGLAFKTETILDIVERLHRSFGKYRYFGTHFLNTPVFVINDVDLIKRIMTKDFDHFTDHKEIAPQSLDRVWDMNLFAARGDRWRDLRSTLSPCFTSSKLKLMFGLIEERATDFVSFFLEKEEDIVEVEMKNACGRFSNDVVATCSFGIGCDSLRNPDNEFYKRAAAFSNFATYAQTFKFLLFEYFRCLAKYFDVRLVDRNHAEFFSKAIVDTVRYREKHRVFRPDMLHFLMEARRERAAAEDDNRAPITDEDIVAQALVFIFGGFDTTSTVLSYVVYELAANRDVQEKARREVLATFEEGGGKLNYEFVNNLKYLDMIISETLRLWVNPINDRIVTKDYTIPATLPGEVDLTLKTGESVWVFPYCVHRDAKYFPEPDKFDPERFSDVNRRFVRPETYFPYGLGPRACIASRFAQIEMKVFLAHLLRNFELVPVEKTVIPAQAEKGDYNMNVRGGMWLGLRRLV